VVSIVLDQIDLMLKMKMMIVTDPHAHFDLHFNPFVPRACKYMPLRTWSKVSQRICTPFCSLRPAPYSIVKALDDSILKKREAIDKIF
jgi:hypothetical protein